MRYPFLWPITGTCVAAMAFSILKLCISIGSARKTMGWGQPPHLLLKRQRVCEDSDCAFSDVNSQCLCRKRCGG